SSRLVRAREQLRTALARRGITLSSLLAGVAIAGTARATVPPALVQATAAAACAAATQGSALPRLAAVLLLGLVLAGGIALGGRNSAPTQDAAPAAKPVAPVTVVTGRVLDPDGRPAEGARISVWKRTATRHHAAADRAGRFRLELPAALLDAQATLVASGPGGAPDWEPLMTSRVKNGVTLRLARDIPVRGLLLDLE